MKYAALLFFIICSSSAAFDQKHYSFKITNKDCASIELKISCTLDKQSIGFIYCVQIPCSTYILHSFYIDPAFRSKGHGAQLLAFTCKLLKKCNAQRIFIQPGPFEIINGESHNVTELGERALKMERLVKIYSKAGFKTVPKFISRCAHLLYTLCNIEEDSNYLMEMKF